MIAPEPKTLTTNPPPNPTRWTTLRDILDADAAPEKKIARLKELELDLRQILVAAEEGMARGEDPKSIGEDDPGVALRRVQDALSELGAEPPPAAPTKAG